MAEDGVHIEKLSPAQLGVLRDAHHELEQAQNAVRRAQQIADAAQRAWGRAVTLTAFGLSVPEKALADVDFQAGTLSWRVPKADAK